MNAQRTSDDSEDAAPARWSLWTRYDQATIAKIFVVLFILLIGSQALKQFQGGHVDIDHAERRPIDFKIDINKAPWPEFTLLPGIGETYARRIVESRDLDGPFTSHEDLQRIRGIGPKTMEKIRPYLLPIDIAESEMSGP